MKKRGPYRSASAPKRREHEHDECHRQCRYPGLNGAVPGDLLQEDREEEEQDSEAGVHGEGLDVADGEVATREQLELQHRLLGTPLVGEEEPNVPQPPMSATRMTGLDQPKRGCSMSEDDPAQAQGTEEAPR
jgi:hypothetical protein